MDRTQTDRISLAHSEHLLKHLTTQQYMHPTWSIDRAVKEVCDQEGFMAFPSYEAVVEVGLGGAKSLGRLSRREVKELATRIEMTWQAELADRIKATENVC